MNILNKKLRLYCYTCQKPLKEIERYSVLTVDDEGNTEIDLSGFACDCEVGDEQDWRLQVIGE